VAPGAWRPKRQATSHRPQPRAGYEPRATSREPRQTAPRAVAPSRCRLSFDIGHWTFGPWAFPPSRERRLSGLLTRPTFSKKKERAWGGRRDPRGCPRGYTPCAPCGAEACGVGPGTARPAGGPGRRSRLAARGSGPVAAVLSPCGRMENGYDARWGHSRRRMRRTWHGVRTFRFVEKAGRMEIRCVSPEFRNSAEFPEFRNAGPLCDCVLGVAAEVVWPTRRRVVYGKRALGVCRWALMD
jgi:hypothetical protein